MNERIRKLAIGCAIQLDWDFPSDPKEYTFSSVGVEKFAELIVRECAKVAFDDWCDGTNEGSSQIAILKHFGVEE